MHYAYLVDQTGAKRKAFEAEDIAGCIAQIESHAKTSGYDILACEHDTQNNAADMAIGHGFTIDIYAIEPA